VTETGDPLSEVLPLSNLLLYEKDLRRLHLIQ
jgi:hypothetical protein